MSKHPHAALMMMYAQDATETEKPWERWEWRDNAGEWHEFGRGEGPRWHPYFKYRRKPRTIRIGNIDVPEPMRTPPPDGSKFWIIWPSADEPVTTSYWGGGKWDKQVLKRGICHATREAAELHAKALLSFTSTDND